MNKTNKTVLIIVAAIIIIGGGIIFFMPDKSEAPSDKTSTSNSDHEHAETVDQNAPVAVTITYDGDSFTSSAQTIKSGENVKVVNNSDKDLDFDSDPHPVHTDNEELNEGSIAPGESKVFKLTTKGTWGYHNHLDASQKGTITVE